MNHSPAFEWTHLLEEDAYPATQAPALLGALKRRGFLAVELSLAEEKVLLEVRRSWQEAD